MWWLGAQPQAAGEGSLPDTPGAQAAFICAPMAQRVTLKSLLQLVEFASVGGSIFFGPDCRKFPPAPS